VSRLLFPDNTVLINFAYIGRMDLLERLAGGKGAWCQSVASECDQSSRIEGLDELARAHDVFGTPWRPEAGAEHLEIRLLREEMASPGDSATRHLGEAETIVLMERRGLTGMFITDDEDAARKAQAHGITSMTTWDLLALALRMGWVDVDTVYGFVNVLRQRRRRMPRELRRDRAAFDGWVASRVPNR
jgi:predicted nucleic acid-binding protein